MWKLSPPSTPPPPPPQPTLQFLGFVFMSSDNYMTEERETCSKLHLHASKLFSSPGSSNPIFIAKSENWLSGKLDLDLKFTDYLQPQFKVEFE